MTKTSTSSAMALTSNPFFAPLSGPVTQMFDFWSNWFDQVGQIGLVNIDLGNTPNPDLERKILDEVGSYGRQLGRLSEALEVLLDEATEAKLLDRSKLSDDQIVALHDFREMLAKVKDVKSDD